MTMKTITLRPQPLASARFAPYGKVIGEPGHGEPDFVGSSGTQGWKVEMDIAKPLYMALSTPPVGHLVTQLERHLNVTQAFFPLGGGMAALAVAKPTEGDALPGPADVEVFLLDGSVGYVLHKGTWHGLDRVPVTEASTMWLMITDSDTQADLANVPSGGARHTHLLELRQAWNAVIEIDVRGLAK